MAEIMKNICFIQYDLQGGGAERKACTLANYFVSKGYNVEVGLYGKNFIAYDLDPKIKVTLINRDSFIYSNNAEKFLYKSKVFIQNNFVIKPLSFVSKKISGKLKNHFDKENNYTNPIRNFVNKRKNTVFVTMMVAMYTTIMEVMKNDEDRVSLGKHYLVMDCNNPKFNAKGRVNDLRNKYYPMAYRDVLQTQGAKDWFIDEIKNNSVIIPNPIKNDLPEPYFGKRNRTIVTYCRLNEQKNLSFFINAFAKLSEEYGDYRLEIYGKGALKDDLLQQINELGISDKAFIFDFDPHIHEKIKDSAMYVLSSDYEGQPNGLMEAMAIGLPCISTDCDFGPGDMINDHENGLLVPCGDVDALYNAMKEYIDNPALAEKCGREAVKVREEYSIEKIGDKWLELINEVGV